MYSDTKAQDIVESRVRGELAWHSNDGATVFGQWDSNDGATVFAHYVGEYRYVGTISRHPEHDDVWVAYMPCEDRRLPGLFDTPEDAATALLAMARGA